MPGAAKHMRAGAIAGWKGPGAEPDTCRGSLRCAILAPHLRNLQLWLVDRRRLNHIVLFCDVVRLLHETDPVTSAILPSRLRLHS